MTKQDIVKTFSYHAPHGDQVDRYSQLRVQARELAIMMLELCPDSREKALALTNLQQSIMWANASIAITESQVTN